ncbi:MAG: HAMP domain-containing sensor histidine kinase [Sporolactobacillus sp.]
MATKLKKKFSSLIVLICISVSLSNMMFGLHFFRMAFLPFDQTVAFQGDLESFQGYLAFSKLQHLSDAQIKALPVSKQALADFRVQNGSLKQQQMMLRLRYAAKLDRAAKLKNTRQAALYKQEQATQMKALQHLFTSDVYAAKQLRAARVRAMDAYVRKNAQNYQYGQQMAAGFSYYFTDAKTGDVITNLSADSLKNTQRADKDLLYRAHFTNAGDTFGGSKPKQVAELLQLSGRHYSGEITVSKQRLSGRLAADYKGYLIKKTVAWIILIGTLAIFAVTLFFIVTDKIRRIEGMDRLRHLLNRLPVDIHAGLFFIECLIVLTWIHQTLTVYLPYEGIHPIGTPLLYGLSVVFLMVYIYQLQWWIGALRHREQFIKCRENSMISRFGHVVHDAFGQTVTGVGAFGLLAAIFVLGLLTPCIAVLVYQLYHSVSMAFAIPFFILCLTALPLLYFTLDRAAKFNRLLCGAEQLVSEERNTLLELPSGLLGRLARAINHLQQGMLSSQSAQLKSERLKTELITNVSHDLRTPLTSILSYSDLLQKSDVTREDQLAYAAIIQRKSLRLKRLIDDLFEASKMASGSIDLHCARTDLRQLFTQALAEYEETMQAAPFDFRMALPEKSVIVSADGAKIWRVIDNLIGNILKYTLEGTRVYIQLVERNGQAIAIFKNITKYELGGTLDELFDRFKRGDASRHTEGSGLGLAIAQSIIERHGGRFTINLDGDLFKIQFYLPLAM